MAECYQDIETPFVYEISGIKKILDGDTFEYYGLVSKRILKDWLDKVVLWHGDGWYCELRCPEREGRGKYGRVLAELWVNNSKTGEEINVNKWMCLNGYAVAYNGGKKQLWGLNQEHIENRVQLHENGVEPYSED